MDALAALLGLDPDTYEGPCPLPGHSGRAKLAAGLPEDRDGDVRLLCCRGRWRSLGEARASIAYGSDDGGRPKREGGRSNIELAIWTRRIAYEAGAFQPAHIALPPLASGASPSIERAWEGFRLLLGLRRADGPPDVPVPYAVRFAAAWCGLSQGAAHHAITALVQSGVIREVERLRGGMRLYLPGLIPEEKPARREPQAGNEDEFIARLIAEFDAEELPPDPPDAEAGR